MSLQAFRHDVDFYWREQGRTKLVLMGFEPFLLWLRVKSSTTVLLNLHHNLVFVNLWSMCPFLKFDRKKFIVNVVHAFKHDVDFYWREQGRTKLVLVGFKPFLLGLRVESSTTVLLNLHHNLVFVNLWSICPFLKFDRKIIITTFSNVPPSFQTWCWLSFKTTR